MNEEKKNENPENVPAAEQAPATSEQAPPPSPPSPPQPDAQPAAQPGDQPDAAASAQPAPGPYAAAYPGPVPAPPVSRDGGFGRFVRNRAVQIAGAGLVGIFIGGGAVATGVAVADNDHEPRWADRSGFSREWQSPGRQNNPFNGWQQGPGQPNQNQGG